MTAEERAKIFKALADPRRVEIVDLLANCSQCGTDLAESLGISMALLCHHWDVLVDAGILRKERVGQKRICTLDTARIREATGEWEPAPAARVKARAGKAAAAGKAAPPAKLSSVAKLPSVAKATAEAERPRRRRSQKRALK
jgi:ArsR family transcriptional regulator